MDRFIKRFGRVIAFLLAAVLFLMYQEMLMQQRRKRQLLFIFQLRERQSQWQAR